MAAISGETAGRIRDQAKNYEPQLIRFMRDLIAIPSESRRERAVCERIGEEMRRVGFDEVFTDPIGNIVGRIGHGKTRIMYDAHIDTVGIGDPEAWQWDPYQGKFEDGKIYGRGAADEKAAIVSMVYGAKIIKDLGLDGDYTLYVVGIVMEEDMDGYASRVFAEQVARPDYAVLGEPTVLRVYRGHRGRCELRVKVKGVACHASAPERGDNAIYKMTRIIQGIERELAPRLKDHPFLGQGSIAVTRIESVSGSLNVVPDECTVYIDRRMTWGETAEAAIAEIKALPGAEAARVELLSYDEPSYTGYRETVPKNFPTWMVEEDHLVVQAGVRAGEIVFGERPEVGKWVFSTDGVSLNGMLGIPTIGFGPGDERYAHTVGEFVPVEDLVKAAMFYAAFPRVITAG